MNYTGNINVKAEPAWKIQHGLMPAVVVEKDTKIPSILEGAPKQDGYELTFNGDKQALYVDAYKKWQNFTVVV